MHLHSQIVPNNVTSSELICKTAQENYALPANRTLPNMNAR